MKLTSVPHTYFQHNIAIILSISAIVATILTSISATIPISILTIIMIPIIAYKTIYITGITIYNNIIAINAISNIIEAYPSL